MKKQSGFTLIELIIVIVILGILAVTAAPQFFNFGGDARTSTVRGMEGSVKAAADLVYARSAVAGTEGVNNSSVNLSGVSGTGSIATVFGYPAATEGGIIAAINADFGTSTDGTSDWYHDAGDPDAGGEIVIRPRGQESNENCQVTYTAAENANTRATVEVDVTEC